MAKKYPKRDTLKRLRKKVSKTIRLERVGMYKFSLIYKLYGLMPACPACPERSRRKEIEIVNLN